MHNDELALAISCVLCFIRVEITTNSAGKITVPPILRDCHRIAVIFEISRDATKLLSFLLCNESQPEPTPDVDAFTA